ncbi:tRNA (uridine(54)-C5)-methyltransferase TrmA [Pseudomonas sp. F1_0610]|uniref:tRNA (uridine(54)-C5)-methyltransferase TrmA n=1 Tax=Pseudomonas sp. F1_0610 TaxID=3114284 RepID=UPI0039C4076D
MLPTDFSEIAYNQQLAQKVARLKSLLTPFTDITPSVYVSPLTHYRMRTEFRLWVNGEQRDYAMFEKGTKNQPILLDNFPIASELINELMPKLKTAWQKSSILSNRLFQVEFLTTLSNQALVTLCYHVPINEEWKLAAEQLAKELGISIIGRSRGKRVVIGKDYVVEKLSVNQRVFSYRQPEGAFSQPNAEVNQKMLHWACQALGQRTDDLLELYCGNGNFTLPFSTQVRQVLATEISKSSVNAALANLEDNNINNIRLVRLSAEELTQALNKVRPFRRLANIDLDSYQFGTVFVDPPRAGMDPDTCELTRRFDRILYISCNPETLAQNIAQLADTHEITACALFDQFPWTDHMESGVLLERKIKVS